MRAIVLPSATLLLGALAGVQAAAQTAPTGAPADSASVVSSANSVAPVVSASPVPSSSASATAPRPTPEVAAPALGALIPPLRYANTWDLNLDFGYGKAFGDLDKGSALVRGRAGVLLVRDNSFFQFGATAEWTSAGKRAMFGAQAEYLHLEKGLWMQFGGAIDTAAKLGAMLGVGYSLFGVEAQVRGYEGIADPVFSLYGKIRIPIGIIGYALGDQKPAPR